jgi:hypothetical protein
VPEVLGCVALVGKLVIRKTVIYAPSTQLMPNERMSFWMTLIPMTKMKMDSHHSMKTPQIRMMMKRLKMMEFLLAFLLWLHNSGVRRILGGSMLQPLRLLLISMTKASVTIHRS